MTQRRPPGRWVTAGNSQIHVHCGGVDTTAATVVLEAGLGGCSTSWTRVIALIAPHARVVAYDRAGHGHSTNPHTATPRTPIQVATQLRDALSAAVIPGPYVLVGHSAGAIYCHAFAAAYPHDIAGLVMVDPSLPPTSDGSALRRWMLPLTQPVTCAAITRLTRQRPGPRPPTVADTARRHDSRSEWAQAKTWLAMLRETRGFAHTHRPSRTTAADLPVVVITQAPPHATGGIAAHAWQRLAASHHTLTGPAPRSRHLYATYAGHTIPTQEPQVVADAIRHLLDHHEPGHSGLRPRAIAAAADEPSVA